MKPIKFLKSGESFAAVPPIGSTAENCAYEAEDDFPARGAKDSPVMLYDMFCPDSWVNKQRRSTKVGVKFLYAFIT
jgi:hypothetical protein